MAEQSAHRKSDERFGGRRTGALWALEPRFMFDAAGVSTTVAVAADQVAQDQADAATPVEPDVSALSADASHAATVETEAAQSEGSPPPIAASDRAQLESALMVRDAEATRVELVFIEGYLSDYQTLLAGIDEKAQVIMLDPQRDGLQQIAEVVAQHSQVDAIHIIADGSPATLKLGSAQLNLETMQGAYADVLAQIGQHLSADADILIYGCYFGYGSAGEAAVATLATLTGADVAASNDVTGQPALGGNWDLEIHYGAIETQVAVDLSAQQTWNATLGPFVVWSTTDVAPVDLLPDYPLVVGGVTITNVIVDTGGIASGAYGELDSNNFGSLGTALRIEQNAPNSTLNTTFTLNFSAGVNGLYFTLADVDYVVGNPSQDEVVINASLGAVAVAPVFISNGVAVQVAGPNTVRGIADVAVTASTDGNVTVGFASAVDQISITYGSGPLVAGMNPGNQFVFLSDLFTNDAPVNTVPGAQTVAEDTALAIAGISVNDANANLSTTQVSVNNGTLTVGLAGGATISAGANSSGSLTLSGTQAQINAALATLSYQGNSNFNGADTLTVLSTDALTGTDTDTVTINVTSVNDAPAGTNNTAVAVGFNTPRSFAAADFGFTDPNDSPVNTLAAVVITTLPPAGEGTLTLAGVAVTAGQVIPAAQLGTLVFTPVTGFSGTGVGSFTFQVQDNGGTAGGGIDTDATPNTFAFNVAANVAPVNTVPAGPLAVAEDTALAVVGVSVSDANANISTTQVSVNNGTLTVSLAGGATISAGANSSGSLTLSGTQAQINAALATLSYQGNSNFNGVDTLTVLSTDAVTATDTDTVTINVAAQATTPSGGAGSSALAVPDNLLNAHKRSGTEIPTSLPELPPRAPDVPVRDVILPVLTTVQAIDELGSVQEVGLRAENPVAQEITRIDQLQFFGDRLLANLDPLVHVRVDRDSHVLAEVARIDELRLFNDRLSPAVADGEALWKSHGPRHSLTLTSPEPAIAGLRAHSLTVHTSLSGAVLTVQLEHTRGLRAFHDVTRFSVRAGDGGTLPDWLRFDPVSGLLTGVPPANVEKLMLEIQADLQDGTSLTGTVEIEPDTGRIVGMKHLSAASADGATSFTVQLAQAASQFDQALNRLRAALDA